MKFEYIEKINGIQRSSGVVDAEGLAKIFRKKGRIVYKKQVDGKVYKQRRLTGHPCVWDQTISVKSYEFIVRMKGVDK